MFREGLGSLPELTSEDKQFISSFNWPGNVRQLVQVLHRWLLLGGSKSIARVLAEIETEMLVFSSRVGGVGSMENNILAVLENARINRIPAADTIGGFIDAIVGSAKRSVFDWLARARPNPEEIAAMFPGNRNANSIRNTIRKWVSIHDSEI